MSNEHSDFIQSFRDAFYEKRGSAYLLSLANQQKLRSIYPVWQECLEMDGGKHHAENVFEHCVNALQLAERYQYSDALRLAALLHDIGKPAVAKVVVESDGQENITFHDHENIGSELAYHFCIAHRFFNEASYVRKLVKYHMWNFSAQASDRAIRRWLFNVGRDGYQDLILLRRVDREANQAWQGSHKNLWAFQRRCAEIIHTRRFIFRDEINLESRTLNKFISSDVLESVLRDLLSQLYSQPKNNNREWILAYLKKEKLNGFRRFKTEMSNVS